MNTRKPIALVAAMLITAAGMAGIATYSNAAADAARLDAPVAASVGTVITTLPAINVYPSREQLRELGKDRKADSTPTSAADDRMPFYSFANDAVGA
jgi:hypothetical protein